MSTVCADPAGRRRPLAGTKRRLLVLAELLLALAICLVGYYFGAPWLQVQEATWTVTALRLVGFDGISGVLPGHVLIFRDGGDVLVAEVTASCSSILSVVGLTALTVVAFRQRRGHALIGLVVSLAVIVVLNGLRLVISTLAGLWFGQPSMVLFHDWVGTLWNLASTLGGFLLMVCVALPTSERAEQDADGRHTAQRPSSWARPGLGYRLPGEHRSAPRRRLNLAGLVYRFVLPRGVSRRMAARREAARIDYRIGHLDTDLRVTRVRELAADGLGAHTASLLAVATYDSEPAVLDALAAEVAARQWEPITSDRVAALRLWARGWTLARSGVSTGAGNRRSAAAPVRVRALAGPLPPLPIAPARPTSFARRPAADPSRTNDPEEMS